MICPVSIPYTPAILPLSASCPQFPPRLSVTTTHLSVGRHVPCRSAHHRCALCRPVLHRCLPRRPARHHCTPCRPVHHHCLLRQPARHRCALCQPVLHRSIPRRQKSLSPAVRHMLSAIPCIQHRQQEKPSNLLFFCFLFRI